MHMITPGKIVKKKQQQKYRPWDSNKNINILKRKKQSIYKRSLMLQSEDGRVKLRFQKNLISYMTFCVPGETIDL